MTTILILDSFSEEWKMQHLLFVIVKLFPYELAKLPGDMQTQHFPECLTRLLIVAAKCRTFSWFQYN
jgi:hypothetical protein